MMHSNPPVDLKDPRIRVTFADVAMRIAKDGPMYGVIILVGALHFRGTTSSMESILGAAIALQARSHPPDDTQKARFLSSSSALPIVGGGAALLALSSIFSGCM